MLPRARPGLADAIRRGRTKTTKRESCGKLLLLAVLTVALALPPLSSTAVTADSRHFATRSRSPAFSSTNRRSRRSPTKTGAHGPPAPPLTRLARLCKGKLEATGTTTSRSRTSSTTRSVATPSVPAVSPSPRNFVANEDFIHGLLGLGRRDRALVATNDIVSRRGRPALEQRLPGDFRWPRPRPQVALISGHLDFHIKAENAEAAGYDAAIIFNEGQPGATRRSPAPYRR